MVGRQRELNDFDMFFFLLLSLCPGTFAYSFSNGYSLADAGNIMIITLEMTSLNSSRGRVYFVREALEFHAELSLCESITNDSTSWRS